MVDVPRKEGIEESLVVREPLVGVEQDKERLYRVQVVELSDVILHRGESLVQGVRRNVADSAAQDVAYAEPQNFPQFLDGYQALVAIVVRFQKKRVSDLHANCLHIAVERLQHGVAAPHKIHIGIVMSTSAGIWVIL